MNQARPLPPTCGIAFKEWAGVRDALASGRQTIILRKGGVHEGPAGFSPEYDSFWIYPTHVHQAEQGLTTETPSLAAPQPAEFVPVGTFVRVEAVARIESLEELDRLADEHIWTTETIRKRFEYRRPGLWLLVTRVLETQTPWVVEVTPAHAGCKTWVPLETSLSTERLAPCLDDATFAARTERIRARLPDGRLVSPTSLEWGKATEREAG